MKLFGYIDISQKKQLLCVLIKDKLTIYKKNVFRQLGAMYLQNDFDIFFMKFQFVCSVLIIYCRI